jgi:hypothetical protein
LTGEIRAGGITCVGTGDPGREGGSGRVEEAATDCPHARWRVGDARPARLGSGAGEGSASSPSHDPLECPTGANRDRQNHLTALGYTARSEVAAAGRARGAAPGSNGSAASPGVEHDERRDLPPRAAHRLEGGSCLARGQGTCSASMPSASAWRRHWRISTSPTTATITRAGTTTNASPRCLPILCRPALRRSGIALWLKSPRSPMTSCPP